MDNEIASVVMTSKQIYEENKKKLTEARKVVKEIRKTVKESASAFFKDEANSLFQKFPMMESFSWSQYTPYFNDGDTCHFSVYNEEPHINGDEVETSKYDRKTGKYVKVDNPLAEAQDAVSGFLCKFGESEFEDMFGDHVTITVTKDAVTTETCDHD